MDKLTVAARRRLMSLVRSKGTAPEMLVEKIIRRRGYRYRLHASRRTI